MLLWGDKQETTVTTTMQANAFQRGDKIQVSGFASRYNNGLFVVRRSMGTQYIMEPADAWDYITHYATKFWQWVRWHYYGMIDAVEDKWNRLRKK